ncbi:MAG: Gldg family protein [Prolixibacteraceae bacterium]|jgi:gliding-associated putative ABC transporter substrate-binding component GldG|nr:Gldg family protein [Prolixibacteraceae bacterium]
MKNKNYLIYILLLVGIVILLNILSSRYFLRADFTADNRYTLSKATKDIVRSIDEPVTVTAYFTNDLPPAVKQIRTEFKELLIEYANLSKGNLVYEFVSPNDDQQLEQELAQKGIAPRMLNVREKDQSVQKTVYLSAVVQYADKEEVLPLILPGAAMEYDLSTAIKKLVVDDKPLIGFIQGHGEPSLNEFMQALQSLQVLYNVESVELSDTVQLEKYEALALIAPTDSIPDEHFYYIDNFVNNGGNVFVAINRVEGDLNTSMGSEITTGLETWLANKGITVENQFVIDNSCSNVSVVQQQGPFRFQTQVRFPYLPIITGFADHPISKGLESLVLMFGSPVAFNGDTTVTATPLAFTSKMSGTAAAPLYFNIQRQWTKNDFTRSEIPVAYAFEGKLGQNSNSRMVVVGDGNFAVNGSGQQAQQLNPDNVNLMVNAIDWLADDTGLIALRTKGITNRPLEQIEDGKKNFLKYMNFLLPVLLIIIYGIIRDQRNRTLRYKRMQDNFVK